RAWTVGHGRLDWLGRHRIDCRARAIDRARLHVLRHRARVWERQERAIVRPRARAPPTPQARGGDEDSAEESEVARASRISPRRGVPGRSHQAIDRDELEKP